MAAVTGLTVVGRISEMLQLHVTRDSHITSVVRIMLAHVVVPSFDEQDAVTLATLGSDRMCIPLESADVTPMTCERVDGVVTLRVS